MFYEEIRPSILLAKYVKCYWAMRFDGHHGGSDVETILPDGSLEIVFNLADRFRRFHADGAVEIQPRSIVVGQMRRFVRIQPTGNVDLFGVRFHTSGAYHYLKCSLRSLTDRIVEPDLIVGSTFRILEERMNVAGSTAARVDIIERLLLDSLPAAGSIEQVVEAVKDHINANNGVVSIRETARRFGVSQRQLERYFQDMVGVSPKFYSRVVRLQSITLASNMDGTADLADLALRHGYYDQSHFIREFAEFSGKSPSLFMREQGRISHAFTDP